MKQPRLGMKSRASRIVRNADLAAELNQHFNRCWFCRSRESRSQDPERLAVLDVTGKRILEWVNASQADERHDDIDAVCRRDLCVDLVADTRLPRRIGKERRVEQRDQGPGYKFELSVGELASDGAQQFGRFRELEVRKLLFTNEGGDLLYEPSS